MDINWDWDLTWEILPRLLWATLNTVAAAASGYVIALVLGLVLALLQRTAFKPLRVVVREFVEFIRSTPLLLQIFFIFFVGPQFGVTLTPWVSGMIAIGLYYAAYLSEVYRGGLESVPAGQWEACKAISLSQRDTYMRIIIPQALPPAMAGLGNYLNAIIKDTPMLSVIGVAELMHAATAIGAERYRFLEPYTMVGIIFLIISLPTSGFMRLAEAWVRRKLGMQ
ncbi:ectoine/hydroxyectoine ABC transporter permease subunit EhuD [Sinorhizobium meliloti]|uniref:ectoine/hydroxyectoine ABC transporter permease subunit EhuD n=1 Tax=Rhizobium meliloti TaxID=382 RepID=UPI000D1DF170|nr:ectoine/hydroxyectoine ABC transporter permease subunit EhuD [Sinorhizobium meliloti]RMI14831.1 ectoine/hydroxyectoine ABC transporter permease subunit EhuD [Sinorhizobium meliloti]